MFRTWWDYPQGDSCICVMVRFARIGVSNLVDSLQYTLLATRLAHIDACKTYHTANATVSLKMNRPGSKHLGATENINLEICTFRWFVLYKRYVDLLYFNQRSLLHVSATYCSHLQGGVL